jgi:hypothetical protein
LVLLNRWDGPQHLIHLIIVELLQQEVQLALNVLVSDQVVGAGGGILNPGDHGECWEQLRVVKGGLMAPSLELTDCVVPGRQQTIPQILQLPLDDHDGTRHTDLQYAHFLCASHEVTLVVVAHV